MVLRKRPMLITLIAVGLLIGVAWHRTSTFEDRWAKVHNGMSKEQVRRILGEPDQTYAAEGGLIGSLIFDTSYEKWAYGRRRMIALQSTFPFVDIPWDGFMGPEHADHVVYFSKSGDVAKKRFPYRSDDHP
ncbi:MAG TPA: hypothetical protein VGP76_24635 [Planctomycetaceae bacterium]|jgi:hypothetical protein|nr:hypothetical protein [Planctomycetaceae bacterium]